MENNDDRFDGLGLSPQEIEDIKKLEEEEAIRERKLRLKYWKEKNEKDAVLEKKKEKRTVIISTILIAIFIISISINLLIPSSYKLNSYDNCTGVEKYEIVNKIKPFIKSDIEDIFDFHIFDSPSEFKLKRLKGDLWQIIVGFNGRIQNNRDRYVAIYTFIYSDSIPEITNIKINSRIRVVKKYDKDGIPWGIRLIQKSN
ncbi:MAG: hypothetical protein E7035_02780 [Verrucomicrobiaceae bacterium]|nr:hypothetical protein [Verrucomicrobiaceae bacterium]